MDDRHPNFVTAIARITGLSGDETISTSLYMPFSRFHITLECPGQTNGRTELLYQYRPLQKLLLVLNCRDCRVFESISSSSYAESCFKNITHLRDRVRTHPTPLVCLRYCACSALIVEKEVGNHDN